MSRDSASYVSLFFSISGKTMFSMKTSAIVAAVMSGTATSSIQRVNRSTITVMYRFPQAVFGSGPNMSMPTVWKGTGELNN